MKSYNILKTIFILLIKEKTTVAHLAEELEVSQRTVKRYLDDILCLNMPIYTQLGRNGGVYFDKDEFFNTYGVTSKELDLMIDAFHANSSIESLFGGGHIDFSEVLRKLKINNIIEIDFSKWFYNSKDDINFSTIKRSISAGRQISFDYYDMYNRCSHRTVSPYKIGFKENNWYLLGFCHLRNDTRIFKIRKMRNVNLLEALSVRDNTVDFNFVDYFSKSKKVVLKMEISKEVIAKVYEDFEIEEIEERGDKLIVTSTRVDNPSLMPLIMSYGGHAKVLAPTEITQKVIEQIELIKKIYKR